jgi:hypothetical protein
VSTPLEAVEAILFAALSLGSVAETPYLDERQPGTGELASEMYSVLGALLDVVDPDRSLRLAALRAERLRRRN